MIDKNGFGRISSRPLQNNNRIIYVDPNDINGDINGAPVTPDYSDYCIWCNLVVEKTSRIKNGQTGTNEVYNITWDASKSEGTEYLSFFRGFNEDYNYLTTDYTEIDFNTVKSRTVIEGLGIESINVSLSNYYVPEVTINFVDVRGSGFFGREEATHNTFDVINLEKNKKGESIDNFYNCFVCFPYPRFKLQIKGFYGKPVTYQLSCSSFTGSLDSNTGDFKLVAKFIGYQYSIMGDIPLEYILAAPLCSYVGCDYWNRHVNSEEWRLPNGETPRELVYVFTDLQSAIQNAPANQLQNVYLTGDEQSRINQCIKTKSKLETLKNKVKVFKESIRFLFGKNYVLETNVSDKNTKSEQMICFYKEDKINLTTNVCKHYNNLVKELEDYVKLYPTEPKDDEGINIGMNHKPSKGENQWDLIEVKLSPFFDFTDGNIRCIAPTSINQALNRLIKNNSESCYDAAVNDLYGLPSTSNQEFYTTTSVSKDLSKVISENVTTSSKIYQDKYLYACIIDFNGITLLIDRLLLKLKKQEEEYSNALEKNQNNAIKSLVGFTPYIGTFFKVVMCHLETFVHIMYSIADVIYDQQREDRTFSNLGIMKEQTDVVNSEFVPPWPDVYKINVERYNTVTSDTTEIEQRSYNNNTEEDIFARGWVGDFLGVLEWEEQKFIESFYLALLNVREVRANDLNSGGGNIVKNIVPLTANDLLNKIPSYVYNNKEHLASYLGLRMFELFNIYHHGNISNDKISIFGKVDALNYVKNSKSLLQIQELLNSSTGLLEEFKKILTGNKEGRDTIFPAEFCKNSNNQQNIYTERANEWEYSYMLNKDGQGIIPKDDNICSVNTMNNLYEWEMGDSGHQDFKCKFNDVNNVLEAKSSPFHTQNVENFLNSNGITDKCENYINENLFTVIDNNSSVNSLVETYKTIEKTEENEYKNIKKDYWFNIINTVEYQDENKELLDKYQSLSTYNIESKYIIGNNGVIPEDININDIKNKYENVL